MAPGNKSWFVLELMGPINVMTGKHNSVFALLKRDVPSLVSIHCIVHKLELGFQDTVKEVKLFKEVKEMLQGIWKHYKYSCKALRELKELTRLSKLMAQGGYLI